MSQELTSDDLQDKIAQRGANGDLEPETHEIEWFGETKTVKTKPITTGLLNELSGLDDAVADLEPDAVHSAIQKIYVTDAILDLSESDIRDMEAPALNSLLAPLEENVEAEFGDNEGNPRDMSRGERAREMRS